MRCNFGLSLLAGLGILPSSWPAISRRAALQVPSRFEDLLRALARAQRGLFEILRVGREDLPTVTFFPNTRIERMFGNSRRRLWWCSSVVVSHTPLSAALRAAKPKQRRKQSLCRISRRSPPLSRESRKDLPLGHAGKIHGFTLRPAQQILLQRLLSSDVSAVSL
jgi:hypothetical protein